MFVEHAGNVFTKPGFWQRFRQFQETIVVVIEFAIGHLQRPCSRTAVDHQKAAFMKRASKSLSLPAADPHEASAPRALSGLSAGFFSRPVQKVAKDLVGVGFFVDGVGGCVVETEAYGLDDPASHSFRGETMSNAAMFRGPGVAYVYRSYGLHWCFNVACDRGSAVLVRALEPTRGLELMRERRGDVATRSISAGPGNLTKALGITGAHNGLPLSAEPFHWEMPASPVDVVVGTRIGISKATDAPWRFGLAGSRFHSRKF